MILGFHVVIRLVGYGPVLCLLTLSRLQDVNWSHYHDSDTTFFSNNLKTGYVLNIPPRRAGKRYETVSATIIYVPGHKVRWHREILFASVQSCESEWLVFAGAPGSAGEGKVDKDIPLLFDELDLVFEVGAEYAQMFVLSRWS